MEAKLLTMTVVFMYAYGKLSTLSELMYLPGLAPGGI